LIDRVFTSEGGAALTALCPVVLGDTVWRVGAGAIVLGVVGDFIVDSDRVSLSLASRVVGGGGTVGDSEGRVVDWVAVNDLDN
jgi:hypothetical protein